jgi:hypothetical protein
MLADGSALASAAVCEAGSVRNSLAVFGAAGPGLTAWKFRGWATRGHDFRNQANLTTGPTEHGPRPGVGPNAVALRAVRRRLHGLHGFDCMGSLRVT